MLKQHIAARVAWVLAVIVFGGAALAQTAPIRFNKNFEGGSLGTIEATGADSYRLHVQGQYDERGHNRQATWFYFRLENAKGRQVTLVLTDFVGEYNDKPGACGGGPDLVPVFSTDQKAWAHFAPEEFSWDKEAKEATLKFTPQADVLWIAHVPPYTNANLAALLVDVQKHPQAVIEVIGKSQGGRDFVLVTVTDPSVDDAKKKTIWLQARQHAWESGTSWTMEGALRFACSEDPEAIELRKRCVMKFTPMVDVDGVAAGAVRFNCNGYDNNRHWDEVDLRDKRWLALSPEIWYHKKAMIACQRERGIDFLINLHNTETGEFLQTQCDDEKVLARMRKVEELIVAGSVYDPSSKVSTAKPVIKDTNFLWHEYKVPVALMELRVATGKKLGRRPTIEDRLRFGGELIRAMGQGVAE